MMACMSLRSIILCEISQILEDLCNDPIYMKRWNTYNSSMVKNIRTTVAGNEATKHEGRASWEGPLGNFQWL